ncbi:MAG: hypothetical protein RLZZ584_3809 [Pseudomonadota bacterium]|jgi:hypothetical protein
MFLHPSEPEQARVAGKTRESGTKVPWRQAMTTKSTWAYLMRLISGPHRRQRTRTPDFADHGTAFGLELSMAQEDIAPPVQVQTRARARSGLSFNRAGR